MAPLQYFRKYLGTSLLDVESTGIPTLADDKTISALDISSTLNESSNEVCVFIVNRSKDAIETKLNIEGVNTSEGKLIQLTALDENAYNVIGEKDIVNISEETIKLKKGLEVAPLSINILVVKKD